MKILLLSILLMIGCRSEHVKTKDVPNDTADKFYFNFEIAENSGMAFSTETKRLYIIEDSYNGPGVYVCDETGKLIRKILLDSIKNKDWEALAYHNGYLYIGDIGDNTDDRGTYKIYKVKESDPRKIEELSYKYETGSTNGEGMAVHPNGTIYITSKKYGSENHTLFKLIGKTAKKVLDFKSKSVGALTISPDGKYFAVIEDDYPNIRIFDFAGNKIKVISGIKEGSKESMEYLPNGDLIYSGEGLDYFKRIKI